jgi:hypothetical protein
MFVLTNNIEDAVMRLFIKRSITAVAQITAFDCVRTVLLISEDRITQA